jgi:hypothetical protein
MAKLKTGLIAGLYTATVTTDGSYNIYQFTADGSITF